MPCKQFYLFCVTVTVVLTPLEVRVRTAERDEPVSFLAIDKFTFCSSPYLNEGVAVVVPVAVSCFTLSHDSEDVSVASSEYTVKVIKGVEVMSLPCASLA